MLTHKMRLFSDQWSDHSPELLLAPAIKHLSEKPKINKEITLDN